MSKEVPVHGKQKLGQEMQMNVEHCRIQVKYLKIEQQNYFILNKYAVHKADQQS